MTTDTHAALVPHMDPEAAGRMNKLGVILLIVGDGTFVLSLVFTYLYLRGLDTEHQWLAKGQPGSVSLAFTWVIAAVAIVSLVAYRWGEGGRDRARLNLGVGAAVLVAVVDMVLQIVQMITAGFTPRDGAYQSAWMALSGYHVVHLLITLFIGIAVLNRSRLGRFDTNRWQVRLVGYWWTWMAVTAVIIAATTSLTTTVAH